MVFLKNNSDILFKHRIAPLLIHIAMDTGHVYVKINRIGGYASTCPYAPWSMCKGGSVKLTHPGQPQARPSPVSAAPGQSDYALTKIREARNA